MYVNFPCFVLNNVKEILAISEKGNHLSCTTVRQLQVLGKLRKKENWFHINVLERKISQRLSKSCSILDSNNIRKCPYGCFFLNMFLFWQYRNITKMYVLLLTQIYLHYQTFFSFLWHHFYYIENDLHYVPNVAKLWVRHQISGKIFIEKL